MQKHPPTGGFTLIELMIVVAIIAILAAIAVPNFLEAQTRAKVSRAKADMRTIVTALESYYIDANRYPMDRVYWGSKAPINNGDYALTRLTTPIAYITSVPNNIFPNRTDNPTTAPQYRYFAKTWKDGILLAHVSDPLYPGDSPYQWSLASSGPNKISNLGEYLVFGEQTFAQKFPNYLPGLKAGPTAIYDPTNGTISVGDITVVGPGNRIF
ncbi:MAG: prepilin-type N-terminal cleavage/methylation domain-containing protein [Candidatus Sumerlaeota bacterium]